MKIIIDGNLLDLPEDEQDKFFKLSLENEVFCTDANGVLWQVLDLHPEAICKAALKAVEEDV